MGRFARRALDSAAMSRVVSLARPSLRRATSLVLSACLLAGIAAVPVRGADLPACTAERSHDCLLPDWSEAIQRDIPSLFGEIDDVVWVDDQRGDAPDDGLDILGVGLGRVTIEDPDAIRTADGLLKLGQAQKAVPADEALLVRIVLDRTPSEVEGGHASIHIATDVDGSRSNNVPSGVGAPDFPFAGSQDLYSLTWAATTGKTKLLNSDLSKAWYKGAAPFAASWAAPNVLDVLVAPQRFGEGFRVITHTAGGDGGYDSVGFGPAAIPTAGAVGLVPTCIEGSIAAVPYVVRRLTENGQTVRNVEAPASWRGGATVPVDEAIRDRLAAVVAAADEDGDGRIAIPTWVNLFEEGLVIRQRPDLELALDGDRAQLALELGLTRRGYNVLRDFEPQTTGDAEVDAWLERATDALRETTPPFRSNKKGGLLVGGAIGSCIPWLSAPVEPLPEASAEPAPAVAAASA
jgi:hypothetical protein